MTRYKIAGDVRSFKFTDNIEVRFDYYDHHYKYFLDILDRKGDYAKMKIYMPDGTIQIGWQHIDWIELHFTDDPFDGRFNN